MKTRVFKRKFINNFMLFICFLTAFYGLFWLFWILATILANGFKYFSLDLFLKDPTPPGIEGGGLRHAFIGHFIITILATLIGVPIGMFAGIYFAEYGKDSKFFMFLKYVNDVMVSKPSIITGALMYALMVVPFKHFNALSGILALAFLMAPVITITTYEMLILVPDTLREAAHALGAYRWQIIKDITLRAARFGILTGIILGVARITGETAPLLFTAFNNSYLSFDLFKPMASLTVTIFYYVMGPYEYWHEQAWAAAFFLTFIVLILSLLAKSILHFGTLNPLKWKIRKK